MNQPLDGRVVLVTGANGGLGEEFVAQALALGASRVYAAARTPRSWADARILGLPLDLTDAASVEAAAATAADVDLVINNAGIAPEGDSVAGGSEADARRIMDTNFFGTLRVAQAFAPVLASNGGGAMLNVLSLASWIPVPTIYAASKAAMWSATNSLRVELSGQGTQVIGLHVGMVDTPMATRWDVPKVSPASVVEQAYAAVVSGDIEVLADDDSRQIKSQLSVPAEQFYPALMERLGSFEA